MRLIDADALRKEIDVDKYGHINTTITRLNIAIERSKVDAVEVVRCKDCMWYDECDWCFFSVGYIPPDGYCSYGERRTE